MLYLLFTVDIPVPESTSIITATFADDTAVLATSEHLETATSMLQAATSDQWEKISPSQLCSMTTFIPANLNWESTYSSFNTRQDLDIFLDQRLNYQTHVKAKWIELNLRLRKLYWIFGHRSQLSLANKYLWYYGLQLWDCSADSNREVIQRFQNRVLGYIILV